MLALSVAALPGMRRLGYRPLVLHRAIITWRSASSRRGKGGDDDIIVAAWSTSRPESWRRRRGVDANDSDDGSDLVLTGHPTFRHVLGAFEATGRSSTCPLRRSPTALRHPPLDRARLNNLLIAMLGDTFQRIKSDTEAQHALARAEAILQICHLPSFGYKRCAPPTTPSSTAAG